MATIRPSTTSVASRWPVRLPGHRPQLSASRRSCGGEWTGAPSTRSQAAPTNGVCRPPARPIVLHGTLWLLGLAVLSWFAVMWCRRPLHRAPPAAGWCLMAVSTPPAEKAEDPRLPLCREVYAFLEDMYLNRGVSFGDLRRLVGGEDDAEAALVEALTAVKQARYPPDQAALQRLVEGIRRGVYQEAVQAAGKAVDSPAELPKPHLTSRRRMLHRGRRHPFAQPLPHQDSLPRYRSVRQCGTPRRYRLTVAYDGAAFHGWQRQQPPGWPQPPTAQQALEDAVREVLRQKVRLFGASRTDAGVSAAAQTCHFDAATDLPDADLRRLLEERLPPAIRVVDLAATDNSFSATNAQWKRYIYTFPAGVDWAAVRADTTVVALEGVADKAIPALVHHLHLAMGGPNKAASVHPSTAAPTTPTTPSTSPPDPTPAGLDVPAMRRAAALLTGTHDFAAFQETGARTTTVRTLHECAVAVGSSGQVTITLAADGFLRKMCRIVAGTLVEVGLGTRSPDSVAETLAARDRRRAGPALPARGLCLQHVEYAAPWPASVPDPPVTHVTSLQG